MYSLGDRENQYFVNNFKLALLCLVCIIYTSFYF